MLDSTGDTLEFPVARCMVPALQPARYKALYGGRGGTKSYFAADYIVARALEGRRCLCLREIQLSLEHSSKQLIEDRIIAHGLQDRFIVYKTHILSLAGGRIDFKGMQNFNAANVKSLEGYDLAWWEEAHTADQYSLDLLIPTIRKDGSELIFTWNPEMPEDPVDAMFRGPNAVQDAILVHCSWRDNPWLPDVLYREMRELYRRDPEKAAWVWGGEYRTISDAQVLKNKYVAREFEPMSTWDGPYQGLDFGFSRDPSAAVRFWIAANTLYVEYAVGGTGLQIDELERYIAARVPDWTKFTTRCDGARPDSIAYLQSHGQGDYVAAKKGQGSVDSGVEWLRSFDEIVVHPGQAAPFLRECKLYRYQTNKAGDVLPKIEDKDNHWMDATRYGGEPLIRPQNEPNIRLL